MFFPALFEPCIENLWIFKRLFLNSSFWKISKKHMILELFIYKYDLLAIHSQPKKKGGWVAMFLLKNPFCIVANMGMIHKNIWLHKLNIKVNFLKHQPSIYFLATYFNHG
jgi:hypothetical protein